MTAPSTAPEDRLLIVGNDGGTNIGASLKRAADDLAIPNTLIDARWAYGGPRLSARVNWWLRDRRPNRLRRFSARVRAAVEAEQPRWLLTTGLAPIDRPTIAAIRSHGVRTISFLTDDPWNPSFRSDWFLEALTQDDHVFSPRRRNLQDLRVIGCEATYLPFGFDPLLFPPAPDTAAADADVCFAGGAEPERVAVVDALLRAEFRVALFGDYWDRYPATRPAWRGHAHPQEIARVEASSAISLCMVRHGNRDGHTMRTFEAAAMGGCLLVEDTAEHRALFGAPDDVVAYFRTPAEALEQTAALVADAGERARRRAAVRELMAHGHHRYVDRLREMIGGGAAAVGLAS